MRGQRWRFGLAGLAVAALVLGLAACTSASGHDGDRDTESVDQTRSVNLVAGLNLVGWTGATAIEEATASLADAFSQILAWDAATQSYVSCIPGLRVGMQGVTDLTTGEAFWIVMDRAATWEQPLFSGPRSVSLSEGFNLAMWTGPTLAIEEALAGLDAADALFRWNGAGYDAWTRAAPVGNTLRTLNSGDAFFVRLTAAATWEQPPRTVPEELPSSPTAVPRSVLGWIPYWDQGAAFASFRDHVELFTEIGLFWYRIDAEGALRTYETAFEDPTIIDFARQHGVRVFAVVANLPDDTEGGDWDSQRVDQVIRSPGARARHIADLVQLTQRLNFDGIHIDYEALRPEQRETFSLFIEELAEALHAEGKLLGVALHPKTSENNPEEDNGSHAQDWARLYPAADHLYFMTYGEHYSGGDPGPIASPSWMSEVLIYALDSVGVPPEKVFMGIPFFAEEWVHALDHAPFGIDEDRTYLQAEAIRVRFAAEAQWDPSAESPFFEYAPGDDHHIVWYEDGRSLAAKLRLADELGISRLAIWRLGGEDPAVWAELERFVTN